MALQRLTKVDGGGLSQTSDYEVGIVTTRGIDGIGIFSGSHAVHVGVITALNFAGAGNTCLLYTSPSPRDRQKSRMPSSA